MPCVQVLLFLLETWKKQRGQTQSSLSLKEIWACLLFIEAGRNSVTLSILFWVHLWRLLCSIYPQDLSNVSFARGISLGEAEHTSRAESSFFCPPQCLHQSAKVKGSKKPSSANGTRAEVLRPHKSETWHQLRREQAGVYACRAALHGGTNMTPNGKLCLEELEEKLQSATHAKICFAPKKRVGRQKTLTVI